MDRGIYIVANDRVGENAIALVNSLRLHDPTLPILLIPFDDQYQGVWQALSADPHLSLYPDLAQLERFTQAIGDTFAPSFLNKPNKMRKLIAWFGPMEDFLYIDTDIVVFQSLATVLDHLQQADFLCCDYHHRGRGLRDIFSPLVQQQGIFSATALQDVFNSGFWGSRRGLFSEADLFEVLRTCAAHPEYFDFSGNTTDQPILNYLVLTLLSRRQNLARLDPGEPGSWAGSSHFVERDHILYDGDRPLRYLHWAGFPLQPGTPYWSLWKHYRYLHEPAPADPPAPPPPPLRQTVFHQLRRQFARLQSR